MSAQLSEKTIETICKTLGATSLSELQERPYQALSAEADVDRDKAALYADRNRGSVRLNAGHYFTVKEYAEHIRNMQAVRLP